MKENKVVETVVETVVMHGDLLNQVPCLLFTHDMAPIR